MWMFGCPLWDTLSYQMAMARTFLLVLLGSCVGGTLLGFGVAYRHLAVNAWQIETETKSLQELADNALVKATHPDAKAQIDETVYNFGVMDAKSIGSHDFYIRNVGTVDLVLSVNQTTCSCLGIDITPSSGRVPPGGTARCHLRYSAEQALAGKFSQGGTVLTNDPDNREIYISVEGVFTNPAVARPSSVNLPRVTLGATRTATIRLYGFEDEPLQLSAPNWTDREHFDFQWETAELTESDKEDSFYSLAKSVVEGTITIKPGLPVGPFQEWFQLRTNYASQPNATFLVSGQIVGGNVSISGQGYNRTMGYADLGHTVMGRSISREITIQFSGASAQSASVRVSAAEPSWIRTELSPPRDAGLLRVISLTITVPEDAPSGSYVFSGDGQQAFVTLETTDEAMPVVRIPLQFAVGR